MSPGLLQLTALRHVSRQHPESPVCPECRRSASHWNYKTRGPHLASVAPVALAPSPATSRLQTGVFCLLVVVWPGTFLGYLADDIHLVSEGPRRRLRSSTDRSCAVPSTHNTFGDRSLPLPDHVSGTASQQTYATRTSPTRVSGVNLKRTGFLAAGAQCDILLNCAVQIALLN